MGGKFTVNVIRVVAGIVGIQGFGEDHMPAKAEPKKPDDANKYITTVHMALGLGGSNALNGPSNSPRVLTGAGRFIDYIRHYNLNGKLIAGGGNNLSVGSGAHTD